MSRIAAIVVLLGVLVASGQPCVAAPDDRQRAQEIVAAAERALEDGTITVQQFLRRCEEAAAVWSADAAVQFALGSAWLLQQDDTRAARYFEEARRLDPSHKPTTCWLATVRDRQGDATAALELFEACLALEAHDAEGRKLDDLASSWLAGARTPDGSFVTEQDFRCFIDRDCPVTRQLEIIRIAPRSDGQCEQRLMLRIGFTHDRSALSGAARKQLDELGRALAGGAAGESVLKMIGYASPEGDDAYNLELSRRRVDAATAYLVKRWEIPAQRIDSSAAGEADPVRNRNGEINYALSRRVELVHGYEHVPCEGGGGS